MQGIWEGDSATVYSVSDEFVFGSIGNSWLRWLQYFHVWKKQDANRYVMVVLDSEGSHELENLSIMCLHEGDVAIKDVHWGADIFLHITAYNIVYESYYMVNCRMGMG